MNPATNYDQQRAKLIRMVHIAANELSLLDPKRHETDPDDEYHLLLRQWNRPGTRQPVTSSTQMNTAQLAELYQYLKRLGFRVRSKKPDDRSQTDSPPSSRPSRPRGEDVSWKKYESSIKGLRDEICDLAKARFGESWELPLNNFCRRFGIERWQWLDVNHGKAVKGALIRLQNPQSEIGNPQLDEVPF
jgi:hypothetical protein